MDTKLIFAILIGIATFAVLIVIIQIILIRGKLNHFQQGLLSSEMTQKAVIVAGSNPARSNLTVYSVILDVALTKSINSPSNSEYNEYLTLVSPQTFSVPHICNNKLTSVNLSCNDPSFIVLQNTPESYNIYNAVKSNQLMYVLIDNIIFFIFVNESINNNFQNDYPDYKNNLILVLFSVNTSKNIVTNALNCHMNLIPFAGNLSAISSIPNLVNTTLATRTLHILGMLK